MSVASQHPNITLMTYSEIETISGYVGNFRVKIRQKAKFVNHNLCTGCGVCWEKCPNMVPNEYDLGLSARKTIYIRFPQAVPNKPVIDRERCRWFNMDGKCGVCQEVCPADAIDHTQEDQVLEEEFGAIVVATGFDLYGGENAYSEYGLGKYADVISGMQFERLSNAAGPTGGKIIRPSDGKEPRDVVFIKCVGSRDEAKGKSYCSRVCCMYTAKHAHQVLDKIEGSRAYVFYMDIRTAGKAYEEFYRRSVEEGAIYIRGRVSKVFPVFPGKDKLIVRGEDTLLGKQVEVLADLVVLATAMIPSEDSDVVASHIGVSTNKDGFFEEAHPKLRPVETHSPGIYLAGTCQGPRDIPDTVSQASAAAVKVCGLFSADERELDPIKSTVNEAICSGCGICIAVCPYKAIEHKTITEKIHGQMVQRQIAAVTEAICQGCGNCSVACRSGAINLKGFTNEQMIAVVEAACQ
jgi:heterodisulfide reductase subunit A